MMATTALSLNPPRTSLMTGLHSGHASIRGNGEFPLRHTTFLAPGAPLRGWVGLQVRF